MDELSETRSTALFEGVERSPEIPTLTILAHPDPERVGEVVVLHGIQTGTEIRLSRSEPAFAAPGSAQVRPLDDSHLSRRPILLVGDGEGLRVHRGTSGTRVEIAGESMAGSRTISAESLNLGVVVVLAHRIALLLHLSLPGTVSNLPSFGLVGASEAIQRVRQEIEMVAQLDTPILLRGESGTGKELVARAIHGASRRHAGSCVTVNMAAIPDSLAAAELFGAARGAFTGADRRKDGIFRRAHGGTLFLDEIGETPSSVQPLLLRALESGEIQPVGSAGTERVDVRLVSATDASLEAMIARGQFRAPLLHRLAGYELRLPTLGERRSDFGRLLYHFLRMELEALGDVGLLMRPDPTGRPWPSAEMVERLVRRDWPGNVRELRNACRRLVVARRADSATLGAALLEPWLAAGDVPASDSTPHPAANTVGQNAVMSATEPPERRQPPKAWRPVYRKLVDIGETEILTALAAHGYQPKAAAEALGVSRGALYDYIAASDNVRKASDVGADEIRDALDVHASDLDAAARALEVSRLGLRRRMKVLGIH